MLINNYGEEICFTYSKDKKTSQMFLSSKVFAGDVAETLRCNDPVQMCAKILKSECEEVDFQLDKSYKSAQDLNISLLKYTEHRPVSWEKFFNTLFPNRKTSEHLKRKCDNIFQIVYNLVHNACKKTPLHINIAETIHDICRSKKLIQIMNRMGLCISYDEMERIDVGLAQRIIDTAGDNRVPVSPSIVSSTIVQGAMDNFDHDENTKSGIGDSHDTILMLFQNTEHSIENEDETQISTMPNIPKYTDKRTLEHMLDCQKLILSGKFGKRGEIPVDFKPNELNLDNDVHVLSQQQYDTWVALRYIQIDPTSIRVQSIPSFTALNSLLSDNIKTVTRYAFTPIIPHPATDFDTIHTCMKNFQDVLIQKGLEYGPLWSDEGVYQYAKELQLLNPNEFSNIFLGLGGFHMEKVILACCGKYMENTGVDTVFVENEIFGPVVVNTVMSGGNYIRGKRGMSLLSEALTHLQIFKFLESNPNNTFNECFQQLGKFQNSFQDSSTNTSVADTEWKECSKSVTGFTNSLKEFIENGLQVSNQFKFWNTFLQDVVSVVRDLARSHREGIWELHLSAIRRAIPLFFAFDRTNYKRWVPLYFEDCMALPTVFPKIYDSFQKGGFVVSQTKRKGSGIPMDQALEKQYNKPAKGHGGIIGITRKKQTVCKWNIIKHEKAQYTDVLHNLCELNDNDEYSLHHEFSRSVSHADGKCVQQLFDYINERQNPFDTSNKEIKNFVTGTEIEQNAAEFLLTCIEKGESYYQEFKSTRLVKKTSKLFDPIPKVRTKKQSTTAVHRILDVKKETVSFMRYIEYARLRGYNVQNLLQYEIATTSFYLTKNGFIRKSTKSELARDIKRLLNKECPYEVPISNEKSMVVIDFMAYCRKVPIKKMNLKTYAELCNNLWNSFKTLSTNCQRIDIIFDVYLECSIKQHERTRRSKVEAIDTTISRLDQSLPVDMDRFWASSSNKMQLQQIFIKWIISNYEDDIPIYLGGAHPEDVTSCVRVSNGNIFSERLLKCDHEEADDRLLFHINHGVNVLKFTKIVIASSDTDVFINALYHYSRWVYFDLKELWVVSGKSATRTAFPIHELVDIMDTNVIDVLPAVHALTGCDTTSKVGTKPAAFKAAIKCGYEQLLSFGKGEITDEMIYLAEKFLVRCISKDEDVDTFDQLRNKVYYKNSFILDLEKLPPTSSCIKLHIQRGYLQSHIWFHAAFMESISIDPTEYGYTKVEEEVSPTILPPETIPEDFPSPCNCMKCARSNICPCRIRSISCCQFCKCGNSANCKNTNKVTV